MSERNLTRLLVAHAGQTPTRLVRQVRLEAAATALVATDQAVSSIAKAAGFRSDETLRQAFSAWFGISGDSTERSTVGPLSVSGLLRAATTGPV